MGRPSSVSERDPDEILNDLRLQPMPDEPKPAPPATSKIKIEAIGELPKNDSIDDVVELRGEEHEWTGALTREAAGARGADEIAAQRLQHPGAGDAGDRRQGEQAKRDRRQHELRKRRAEHQPFAGEQAVDGVSAGDARRTVYKISFSRPTGSGANSSR